METRIWSRASAHHCKSIQDILIQMTARCATTSAIHGAVRRENIVLTITIKVNAPPGQAIGVKEHLAMCLERFGDVRVVSIKEDDRPEQMQIGRGYR